MHTLLLESWLDLQNAYAVPYGPVDAVKAVPQDWRNEECCTINSIKIGLSMEVN